MVTSIVRSGATFAGTSQGLAGGSTMLKTSTGRGICAALAALALTTAPASAEPTAPSAQPSRVVLTPTGTPSTSHAVTWRTDAATETGKAEIRPVAGDGATRTIAAR